MTANVNLKILMAAVAAALIAGAFYIMHLRSDLVAAQERSSAAQRELLSLKVTISRLEGERTTVASERDALQAQLSDSKAQLMKVSDDREKADDALTSELSALRMRMSYENKVSGWWRELFDYTKPFNRGDAPK